jgi:hypothetical protein
MKNVRDHDRDMYIYHAHKVDKRTFADIGRELGITGNRVRQVYVRTDCAINKWDADLFKGRPELVPSWWRQEKEGGIL